MGGFSAPVIIYDPSGELRPGMRDAIAQQTDIMPTVLSYLHYGKPYFAFGCDLLTTPPADTYAINYLNGAGNEHNIQCDYTKVTAENAQEILDSLK